ncbi:FecR family protein [bacterium]|nr:FecR family protein [bacterium]
MKRESIPELSEDLKALDRALGEAADRRFAHDVRPSPAFSAQLERRLEEVDLARSESNGSRGGRRSLVAIAILAAAACVALVAGLSFLGGSPAGQVLYTEGNVLRGDRAEVRSGSELQTDSGRIVALVDSRAHVLLNDHSKLRVEAENRLRLDEGEVWVHVVPGSGAFSVRTPGALVEVVGTSFTVTYRNGETTVETYSGTVQLTGSKAAEGVAIAAGNRGSVRSDEETAKVEALSESSGAQWAASLADRYQRSSLSSFFPSVAPVDESGQTP